VGAAPLASSTHTPSPTQWVGRFDSEREVWREIVLSAGQRPPRPNAFRFMRWDGVHAVEVVSDSSMSLLARPITVDLNLTPVLCWRWRVDATLRQADMRRREGDDYAARVYVSFRLPPSSISLSVRAQLALARVLWGQDLPDAALNYVWDHWAPAGTTQPNAYTDRAHMIVLRSGEAEAGRWVWERVDVRSDVTRHFGPGAHAAHAIQLALGADTDNTGSKARAGFADFHFVPATSQCASPTGASKPQHLAAQRQIGGQFARAPGVAHRAALENHRTVGERQGKIEVVVHDHDGYFVA